MANNHPSNKVTLDNVEDLFHYHRPTAETIPKYDAINVAALELAKVILKNVPDCAFRSSALTQLTLTRMLANAAIATAPAEQDPLSV